MEFKLCKTENWRQNIFPLKEYINVFNLMFVFLKKLMWKLLNVAFSNKLLKTLKYYSFLLQASTIDGRRKGACLFCQEYFMDLYLLAELKTISLKVTTVDMQKPPPDFRTNFEATPPPILIDRGMAVLENEKIERHIMKSVPGGHNLFIQAS